MTPAQPDNTERLKGTQSLSRKQSKARKARKAYKANKNAGKDQKEPNSPNWLSKPRRHWTAPDAITIYRLQPRLSTSIYKAPEENDCDRKLSPQAPAQVSKSGHRSKLVKPHRLFHVQAASERLLQLLSSSCALRSEKVC